MVIFSHIWTNITRAANWFYFSEICHIPHFSSSLKNEGMNLNMSSDTDLANSKTFRQQTKHPEIGTEKSMSRYLVTETDELME